MIRRRSIGKVLIANRGEIARRIRRTATEMGIRTVAVYTEAEREALHVLDADEAIRLDGEGPGPYLDVAGLVSAARAAGADAVHPGYGFLAENASFARAVADAGLVWVGPPPDAIARMGDKLEAKAAAREAGVPTLEASGDEFPVLVKAAFGGGGKGMRVVRSAAELEEAKAAAVREAERAFGDGTVFLEPYLERARHVEIQVLGDGHGTVMHLFERECSIQRRHQKVIEEAPSVAVDDALRARMGEAAVSLAQAIGYRNAGTVEFLLAPDGRFYFLEMNTRLQVEHPVTEMITGVDIVRQQFLDAAGERLECSNVSIEGHAIEARLNAEDAANGFLPAAGPLVAFGIPMEPAVRWEDGYGPGSVVTTSFDPLLAKVIAHGSSREEAAASLALALEGACIQGVATNRDLLVSLLRSDEFGSGDTTTDFLDRVELSPVRRLDAGERELVCAAVVAHAEEAARAGARVLRALPSGFRNSVMPPQVRTLHVDGEDVAVSYRRDRSGTLHVDAGHGYVDVRLGGAPGDPYRAVEVGGRTVTVTARQHGDRWWVHVPWGDVEVVERSPFPSSELEEVSGSLHAPMPGSVVTVPVSPGDEVRKGQTLVVLEAMKMEHPIASPEDGVVTEVNVKAGEQVERGALLVVVQGPDEG